jgi:septum formation topological specificity factor MinE
MEFLMKFSLWHRLFGPREDSRSAAKDRLRNALVGDRCTVAPALMECMTADLLGVLRKYMVVDHDLKLSLSEREGAMRFTAGVGVVRVLRQAQLPAEALDESRAVPKRKLRGVRRKSQEE